MEETEMNTEIWSRLPQELLVLILAHLPTLITVKFRAVCKRWKCLLSQAQTYNKQISPMVPHCPSPAFLFGGMPCVTNNSVVDKTLYLLQLMPNSNTYKLSLDFLEPEDFLSPEPVSVVAYCKSVLCCCSSVYGTPISIYLCNPVTRTFRKLPTPTQLNRWHFIGMAFDISTKRCMLVKGSNHTVEDRNNMVMEMYDSNTNTWTQFNISNVAVSVFPSGHGVYSRGKFYWINEMRFQAGLSTRYRFDIAVFNVTQSHWDVIRKPQRPNAPDSEFYCFWQLTGHDGKVVLVYNKNMCLWRLNEDEEEESYRWSEFQAFPRSIYEEEISSGNIANNLRGLRSFDRRRFGYEEQKAPPQVIVNSCGCVLVHLHKNKLIVFDGDGRLIESIQGPPLRIFEQSEPRPYAYEINNVMWP